MKIATTTGDFSRFLPNDVEIVRALHRAGFRYIDLDMYFFTPSSPYMSDDWKSAVQLLKDEADRLQIKFVQAHSQGGNAFRDDADHVDFLVRSTQRSIEICHELGISNTVVHPGCADGVSKEEWFERNRAFYQKLFPYMEAYGVNVLIENATDVNTKGKYWASTGKEMVEFLRYVDHPLLHACWDTGHGNCEGPQYNEILDLGKELYAIHYNDNRGKGDDHVIPYLGTLNNDEILNALIDVGYKGYFTLEATSSTVPAKRRLKVNGSFDRDLRNVNPPLFMQERLVELMYDVSKHLLDSYGLFEE